MKINNELLIQRIYEKTRELLINHGIKGWNMDKLANEAGITKITLYKIIESKEKLLETVIINHLQNNQKQIAKIMESNENIPDTFLKIVNILPVLLNNKFTEIVKEIILEYPSLEKDTRIIQNDATNQIINFIKVSIEKGYLRNDLKHEFIFEMIKAFIQYFIKTENQETIKDKIELAFDCLFNGIINSNKIF